MIKPNQSTFNNYAEKDFVPKVSAYATKQTRTDVVFDTYISLTLLSLCKATASH
jgi:hypothetical protein